MRIIDRVARENKFPCSSLEYNKESVCDACQQGKIHWLAFPKSTSVSLAPLDLSFLRVGSCTHICWKKKLLC
jgi:hypothetical protein